MGIPAVMGFLNLHHNLFFLFADVNYA